MSKIYVVDYGISGCDKHNVINALLKEKGWKCTGFNTTYWKDVEGKCDVKTTEETLRGLIQRNTVDCTVTLLIVCVEKSDVIGTKGDEMIFGCGFKYPKSNNEA